MSESPSVSARRAVFLSYASQDAKAARRICESLRNSGVEVWFDQEGGLEHGDEWDRKIRQQLKECALFVPIISASTQARREGYFRLEWKLAAQRTQTIADGTPFLMPVVMDGTRDVDALVPDEFRTVQWTKLPGGETSPAFVARVQKLLGGLNVLVATSAPVTPQPAALTPGPKAGSPIWVTAALGLGLLALAAYVVLRSTVKESGPPVKPAIVETKPASVATRPPAFDPAAPEAKSVAVLAFANLSADKDNEYFSDGLSENILDKLARVPGLRVMARTSSFSYKGKNVPLQQIAQELHVGTVIEGSVQRAGNTLRVVAQLINAADGMHVWSETYDKELTTAGIFAIQDEIALKIAARLAPSSAPAQGSATVPTKNLKAYEAYLRGREQQVKVGGEARTKAAGFFGRATELDPGFALAWAQLARTHALLFAGGDVDEDRELALARAAIDQAQRLQPDLPDIHLALATFRCVVERDNLSAARELDLLARIRPEDSETCQQRGTIEMNLGRFSDAIAALQRSVALDPKSGRAFNMLGVSLYHAGRYSEAMSAFENATQIDTSDLPLVNRATVILRWRGDPKMAVKAVREIPIARLSSGSLSVVIRLFLRAGDHAKALELAEQAGWSGALSQNGYLFSDLLRAEVRETMGDIEGARRDYQAALPHVEHTRDAHSRSFRAYLPLAQVYAGLGRKEEALAAAHRSLELLPANQDPRFAADSSLRILVDVEGRFGMVDEALEVVRQQIAAGWWKRNDLLLLPDFIHLQKDPRFCTLAEKAPL